MIDLNSVVLAAEEFTKSNLVVVSLYDFPAQILLFLLPEALQGFRSPKHIRPCAAVTWLRVPRSIIGKATVPNEHLALGWRLLVSTVSLWRDSNS